MGVLSGPHIAEGCLLCWHLGWKLSQELLMEVVFSDNNGESRGSDSHVVCWWVPYACPHLCPVLLWGRCGPLVHQLSLPSTLLDPPTSKGLEKSWGYTWLSAHSQLSVCGHSCPPGMGEESPRNRFPPLWLGASWAFVKSSKFGVTWLLEAHQPPSTFKIHLSVP